MTSGKTKSENDEFAIIAKFEATWPEIARNLHLHHHPLEKGQGKRNGPQRIAMAQITRPLRKREQPLQTNLEGMDTRNHHSSTVGEVEADILE